MQRAFIKQVARRLLPSGVRAAIRQAIYHYDPQRFARQRSDERFYLNLLGGRRDLIFDIGANRGEKAAVFAKLAERVICAEPSRDAVDALQRRFRANPEIIIVPKGVGDSDRPQLFQEFQYDGYNSIRPKLVEVRFPGIIRKKVTTIPMTTLDDLIEQFGMPYYVKIDVEGWESAVLRGLSQSVPVISFEVILPEFLEETIECIRRLASLSRTSRFNYTRYDPLELQSSSWMSPAEMGELVHSSKINYMEIYCRS